MTSLRQRMLEDMQIRNFSQNTQRSYLPETIAESDVAIGKHSGIPVLARDSVGA